MAHLPAAVRLLMQKRAAQAESGEAEPSAKRLRTDLPLPYSTPPSQPSAGQRPPSMAAALRAAPAPRPVVVVPKATPAAAAALQMNAAALASATAAAMRPAVAPQPHRSHEEVKKALTALHCKMEKDASPRELLLQLQEVEGHVKRAEATKSLPKRHDQAIIACFKDGYTPGTEGLVKMLESGIDPDTPSTGFMSGFAPGMTPLLAAASWGKVDEARILLAAGADVRVKSPNINHTVLHMAAGGNVDGWGLEKTHNMLRLILEAEPALLTARNGMNKTAAEWAKHEKKRQSAQFLSHYATMNPGLSSR